MNVALPADGSIPPFLDRRKLVYTFSNLSAYKNCGHQMYRRYIVKDVPYVESPQMKEGNDGHLAFEQRVGSGKPLPVALQQWETFAAPFDGRGARVEQKLGMTDRGKATGYWDSDCWFRGRIDVALVSNETAFINDWKFGKSNYEDPFELEVGALLLKAKHPELKVIKGQYVWLKENRTSQLYDLSRFRDTWNEINRLVGLIESDRQRGEFEKKPSGLCAWCDVKDCQHWRPRK